MPRFCVHSRLFANCPICRAGTPLDPTAAERARIARRTRTTSVSVGSGRAPARRQRASGAPSPGVRGRAVAGGLEDERGERYEVRLEAVPGGVRLAEWADGLLRRRAPRLPASDLARLARELGASGSLPAAAGAALATAGERLAAVCAALPAKSASDDAEPSDGGRRAMSELSEGVVWGVSRGRAGELREEFRVEPLEGGFVRVGRWVEIPGRGFELREAPLLASAERLAEAIASLADHFPRA